MAPTDDARGTHAVHIDVTVAEQLVKASAMRARGALTDQEFVDLRERLLTGGATGGGSGTA